MTDPSQPTQLPLFLRNPEAFAAHLADKFQGRSNLDKGDGFTAFACKVLPLCDFWGDMPGPVPSAKRTHDRGIDLVAEHPTRGTHYFGQAKFRMREKADLDDVISKFANFDRTHAQPDGELQLFPEPDARASVYVLVTSTDLSEIRRRYEGSQLPSLTFYRSLEEAGRIQILDGPRLLRHLQALYRQSFIIHPEIDLRLDAPIIHVGSVYLSVVSGAVLRSLFQANGSSLFFENIREFLGVADKKADARGG
ncbi:MAG: hypothetical protein H6710_15680 [Myxococcales bacterium]|nr:hypothetical protein [Myxococcales bacterium]